MAQMTQIGESQTNLISGPCAACGFIPTLPIERTTHEGAIMRSITARFTTLVVCLASLCGCSASSNSAAEGTWNTYGQSPMGSGPAVSIGALSGSEENIIIHGTIKEVCKIKGCWMTLADDSGRELFVQFKDYGFFVPRNAVGRTVVIHGQAKTSTMSVEELRHYAADAKKSPEEIAAITQPETRTSFIADSVMIAGRGLDKPYQAAAGEDCKFE